MKIIITENQYNKIFLSGKYDNLIFEAAPPVSGILKKFIGIIDEIKPKKSFSEYFDKSTIDNIKGKFNKEFIKFNKDINNFDNMIEFLSTIKGEISPEQFNALFSVKNIRLKDSLQKSLANNDKIRNILGLYKQAESLKNSKVKEEIKKKLNQFFDDIETTNEFIDDYKGTTGVETSAIETIGIGLDKSFDNMKNVLNFKQKFNDLNKIITNLEDFLKKDILKDPQLKKQLNDARKKLDKLIIDEKNIKNFTDYIIENEEKVKDLIERFGKIKPGIATKIKVFFDKLSITEKGVVFLLFMSLLVGIGFETINAISKIGLDPSELEEELKEKIKNNKLKIIIDGNVNNLTAEEIEDFNNNEPEFNIAESGDLFIVNIGRFFINNTYFENPKFSYNPKEENNLKLISAKNYTPKNYKFKNFSVDKTGLKDSIINYINSKLGDSKIPEGINMDEYFELKPLSENNRIYQVMLINSIPNTELKKEKGDINLAIYLRNNGLYWYRLNKEYENDLESFKTFLKDQYGLNYAKDSNNIIIKKDGDIYSITPKDSSKPSKFDNRKFKYVESMDFSKNKIYGININTQTPFFVELVSKK